MAIFSIDHVLVCLVNLLKTIATTGAIFSLQFTKNRLADQLVELERSPDPLAAIGGLLLRGGERRGEERMEWEGRGGDRKGWEGRGGEGEGVGTKTP